MYPRIHPVCIPYGPMYVPMYVPMYAPMYPLCMHSVCTLYALYRCMQQHNQDATAMVPSGAALNDIPTLAVRLFNIKLQAIISDIYKGFVFGPVLAYVYTIEF